MQELPSWALANAVTAFATLSAGVLTCVMGWLVPGQPRRWLHAYFWIFLTGIPTLGLHGYGEPFQAPSHAAWSVSDTGSNLIVAWALQVAVLGDFHERSLQWRIGALSLLVNLAGIGQMIHERFFAAERHYLLPLGDFGGFHTGEVLLIADSVAVVVLFYSARHRIAPRARPLLNLVAVVFALGLGLATASNQQIGVLFGEGVLAYHALWHIIGAMGFLVLFVFNQIRFAEPEGAADQTRDAATAPR